MISCINAEKNENKILNNDIFIADSLNVKSENILKKNKEFNYPVDLKKLLSEDFLETTSGVIPKSETKNFYKPFETGFFGSYTLLNTNDTTEKRYIGNLIVFTTEQAENWRQDSENQFFVEIELEQPIIFVWDSISVGISENKLLDFIGDNFHYKKGTLIYSELGDYTCNFYIVADTIRQIKIGKYKKNLK